MKKAFTLIEILVVITIITMLATVGAGSYSILTKNSLDSRRKADLEQIRASLEMWRSNNGTYPTLVPTGAIFSDGVNTYLQKVPTDPKTPIFNYNLVVTANTYTLGAYLENMAGANTCGSCGTTTCNYCITPYGLQ